MAEQLKYSSLLRVGSWDGPEFAFEYRADATVADLSKAIVGVGDTEALPDLFVWSTDFWLEPDCKIRDVQLAYGQVVTTGVRSNDQTVLPSVNAGELYRLVHDNGSQFGFGWPIFVDSTLGLAFTDGYWRPVKTDSDVVLVCSDDGVTWLSMRTSNSETERSVQEGDSFACEVDGETHRFKLLLAEEHESSRLLDGKLSFQIPARVWIPAAPETVRLRSTSHPREDQKSFPYLETILQVLPMVAITLILIFFTQSIYAFGSILLVFALPAMQVVRHYRSLRERDRRLDDWAKEAGALAGTVRGIAETEALDSEMRFPSLDEVIESVRRRSTLTWSIRDTSEDFLKVKLGVGSHVSDSVVIHEGILPVDAEWEAYYEAARTVPNANVEYLLRRANLGFLGESQQILTYLEPVLLRLLLTHPPSSLGIVSFLPRRGQMLRWLEYAPHADLSAWGWFGESVIRGRLNSLRAAELNAEFGLMLGSFDGHVVLVVHESSGVPLSTIQSWIAQADGRISMIWLGLSTTGLVDNWIDTTQPNARLEPNGEEILPEEWTRAVGCLEAVAMIQPLVEASSGSTVRALPSAVPLGKLVDPQAVWDARTANELIVANAVSAEGTWHLDLVKEGPHMLAAGITGSGKSEYVRSLVLSLAARYSPRELRFLLVDYKGGASLGQLQALPHSVGMVSSLGEIDVARLIKYLNRELLRRQEILAPFEGEYEKYRRRTPASYLPRLVVVIDEFQGFVDGGADGKTRAEKATAILNVAARGRSAGIHLVIATQNPSSDVVSPAVLANVGVMVCLRTADGRGSVNVLGVDVAARIPSSAAGRFYLKTGSARLALLQSAYTQADYLQTRDLETKIIQSARRLHADFTAPGNEVSAGLHELDHSDADLLIRDLSDRWKNESSCGAVR